MSLLKSPVRLLLAAALFILPFALCAPVWAAQLQPISFPAPEGKAFDIVVDGAAQSVSLAELESLGLYRVTTTTPWEKGEFTFEGPLLADVVAYLGLTEAPSLILRAIDGFTAIIPREDWSAGPVLLATRRDGALLSRRAQGPTRIVYPETDHPDFTAPRYKARWIWLIESIEPVS